MAGTVPIVIELDENAPIKSLAQLHRIAGLAKIHFNFDVFDKPRAARREMLGLPAPAPKENGHQRGKSSPSQEIIKIMMAHGGPMTRKEIKAAGGENGEQLVSNLASLANTGRVKKVGPATYELVDGSHAAGTKKTERSIILEELAKNGPMSKKDFNKPFVQAGLSFTTVTNPLTALLNDKEIKRVGKGLYKLA